MPSRTLRRKLAEHNTGFQKLLDAERRRLASRIGTTGNQKRTLTWLNQSLA
jgi:hypothetical protein